MPDETLTGREARPRNVPLVVALIATLVATALAYLHVRRHPLPLLGTLEGVTIDARFHLRGSRAPATDRIVIVGIDDATRREDPELMQTRRGYARLVTALATYHPELVAFDLFFGSPETLLSAPLTDRVRALVGALPPRDDSAEAPATVALRDVAAELGGDEALAAAVTANGRVVLGAFFGWDPPPPGQPADRREPPEPAGLARARHGEVADAGGGGSLRPITTNYVLFSLPAIARGALAAGAVNTLRDSDGVTRRMPLSIEYGGRQYMSLGLAVALIERGRPGATRYVVGDSSLAAAGTELPLSGDASLELDVLGPGRIPRISAADVLAHRVDPARLAGKLVFVGHTFAASDKVITPLDPAADGVELHATLAENILAGHVLHQTGWVATVGSTLLLCGIVALVQLRRIRRRAWVPPLIALAVLSAYVMLALALFATGTVIALAVPVVLASLVLVAATIGGLVTEGREKAHLRAVFSQYVSRPVVDRILSNPRRAKLGGERKELTVMFSDIRGFSHVAEGMAPEELAAFLHEYLTPMTDLVLASGGTLDKYIGDAIMAIWGAPIDSADHAAQACEVALRMNESLATLNRAWSPAGKPVVSIGIGINTGAMAVGNMGSTARFEYTVLGDQVNLGARLEALTKEYGVGILVGEATARTAGDRFLFREIDLVRVKGRAGAVPVFELVGRAGTANPTFARALALYRERAFAAAGAAFTTLADDPAAAVMAARCAVLAATPPPLDWDGVYDQRSK